MIVSILRRHCVGGSKSCKFKKIGQANSITAAKIQIIKSENIGDVGDIIATCEGDDISSVASCALDFWVVDFSEKLLKVPPLPLEFGENNTWLNFWESKNSIAHDMLDLASTCIDKKSLTLAACACARTTFKYIPEDEVRLVAAVEKAELWSNGMSTLKDVKDAADIALRSNADPSTIHSIVAAAYTAIESKYSHTAAYYAYEAGDEQDDVREKLAGIVRYFIPLEKLMLALVSKNR